MEEEMNVSLQDEIIADLTLELKSDDAFDADVLKSKVVSAIKEVRMKRNYTATSYKENDIEKDLNNYYSVIKNVALYDYNQRGVEGQSSHSENSVNRTWINRDELFRGVHAFVKVL